MTPTGDEERAKVNYFFGLLRAMYGKARFESAWGTEEELRVAKRFWAGDIAKYSKQELERKVEFAKGMLHHKDWRFPDVAVVLKGDRQTEGQGGMANLSYQPANKVMGAPRLSGPSKDELKAQRRITAKAYQIINSLLAPDLMGKTDVSDEHKAAAAEYVAEHWRKYGQGPMPPDVRGVVDCWRARYSEFFTVEGET